ncbi:hypothetical protein NC99_41430 [Sunxiuqinia dokdonensis]|uniref:Uncharacterized protein n=1 Tax=Sunxiuqinia dokdonensis TaxID=1409788 RepID=A0A0L8V3Q0_9BACT|nr:hypothetical protein NC99_41430 [Sunxiuqinia dokdonensis]
MIFVPFSLLQSPFTDRNHFIYRRKQAAYRQKSTNWRFLNYQLFHYFRFS